MALITTYEHFSKIPVIIPNVSSTGPDQTALNDSIAKFEPEYLKAILGYELYKLFEDGRYNSIDKYLLILNGSEYTNVYGVVSKWEGFVSGMNPIANYVYYEHITSLQRSLTGVGVTTAKVENSILVDAAPLMIDAWNEMVDFNRNLHNFLWANESDYPEYIGLIATPPRYRTEMLDGYSNQQLFIKQNRFGF